MSWRDEPGGSGFWAVTRYADVLTVVRNPSLYSSWRGGVLLNDPPPAFLAKLRLNMLNSDPPRHTALRRLVNRAFTPRRLAELEERIAAHARVLVDRAGAAGRCDFAAQVAGEMPLFVICEILGVPLDDRHALFALTERMLAPHIPDRAAAFSDGMAAAEQMRAYGAELGRARRANPQDDLVSDLLAAQVDGQALTQDEFESFFMLLFNAGSETTRSLLAHGLSLLIDRPADLEQLRAQPALLPGAIEEVLRFEPPVIQFRRTATADTELAGRRIRAGNKVVVFFPAANRDEAVFSHPDRFEIERSPNPHLSFGHGAHFCLGAPLARLEAKHVFREVLTKLHGIERDGPLVPYRSALIRGVKNLPIRFDYRASSAA